MFRIPRWSGNGHVGRRTAKKNCARVVVICGGTFLSLGRYLSSAGADIVACFDVPDELDAADLRKDVVTVRLAEGETLGTLVAEGCSPEFRTFYLRRPGVNLGNGLGQLRKVGQLVIAKLLKDPRFRRLLNEEIFTPLLVKHNGQLDQVEIVVCSSAAGGTGGPIGPAVARELAQLFEDNTEAVIQINLLRVGSLSYVGLGERIHQNVGAGLAEDVTYVLSGKRHPREVRILTALELPMVGNQKDERDQFVVQLVQALQADDTQEIMKRLAPNRALDTPLGTARILQPAWWQPLSDRSIAAEVAQHFLPQFERMSRIGPQQGVVESVHLKLIEDKNTAATSLEELVSRARTAGGVQPEGFMEACLATGASYVSATVHVKIHQRSSQNLSQTLRVVFSAPPTSVKEHSAKLATMKAARASIHHEVTLRRGRIAPLDRRQRQNLAELRQVFRRLFPKNLLDKFLAKLSNPNAVMVRFKNAVTEIRRDGDELARLKVELAALESVCAQLDDELQAEQRRLERAVHVLNVIRTRQRGAGPERLVDVGSLDSVLAELLEAVRSHDGDSDNLLRLFGSCARGVTLSGLAQITGAAQPRAVDVAERLTRGKPTVEAPVGGARNPSPRQA